MAVNYFGLGGINDFFIQDELTYIQALPFIFHQTTSLWVPRIEPGTLFKMDNINIGGSNFRTIRPIWVSEITANSLGNFADSVYDIFIGLDRIENNQYNSSISSIYIEWGNFLIWGSVNWSRVLVWDSTNNRFVSLGSLNVNGALRYVVNNIDTSSAANWNASLNNILSFRAHPRYRNIAGGYR